MSNAELVAEFQGPLYLYIQNDKLYSLKQDGNTAGIAIFEIPGSKTGELRLIDECLPEGENGCYLTVSSDYKYILDALYAAGKVRFVNIRTANIFTRRTQDTTALLYLKYREMNSLFTDFK